ncbi:unnamed protein product [Orchesella dallaii]|uniref:Nucleolus and neural progenitor protein-like N-terminal domain-containing protein n=1 Tax=Orchesella dallaii TaxID=48710 RepID=A0ABP1QLZ6_9HEXA
MRVRGYNLLTPLQRLKAFQNIENFAYSILSHLNDLDHDFRKVIIQCNGKLLYSQRYRRQTRQIRGVITSNPSSPLCPVYMDICDKLTSLKLKVKTFNQKFKQISKVRKTKYTEIIKIHRKFRKNVNDEMSHYGVHMMKICCSSIAALKSQFLDMLGECESMEIAVRTGISECNQRIDSMAHSVPAQQARGEE